MNGLKQEKGERDRNSKERMGRPATIYCEAWVSVDDVKCVQAAPEGNRILCVLKEGRATSVRLSFLLHANKMWRFMAGRKICRGYGWNQKVKDLSSAKANVLQLASSEWSEQSRPPSHLQLLWMHFPFAHWNSEALQRVAFGSGRPAQFSGHSSDPSAQSSSPSQRQRAGTQTKLWHWKEWLPQVGLLQEASSEPSEQSLSWSQTKSVDIHWPLVHRNSFALHSFNAGKTKDGGKEELAWR